MKGRAVVLAVADLLRADAGLVAALGGAHVYRQASQREARIPSVELLIVSDTPRENTGRVLVQVDTWSTSPDASGVIEGRIFALLHSDLPQTLGGLKMFTTYQDSRDHEDPEPGVVHWSMDFMFEPHR